MDTLLCGDGTPRQVDSFPSNGSTTASTTTSTSEEVVLECDYDTSPTKLYQAVEQKKWEDIAFFLETGSWNNSLWLACGGIFGGPYQDPPSVEARTWVTAINREGHVRWCQLPIHAAITFQAPLSIIQKLLEVYPKSARSADDQGLLPLHYAFRFGSSDEIVWHILQAFPQAMRKKAAKNRFPLDLAPFSTRPERGYIIERFVESAVKVARVIWETEYETMALQQQEYQDHQQRGRTFDADFVNQDLERRLYRKTQKLTRAMQELKQTQLQLHELQNGLKDVTATNAPTRRTNPAAPKTRESPEEDGIDVNSILGPYNEGNDDDDDDDDDVDYHNGKKHAEARDDEEAREAVVEDDQTAIRAPKQHPSLAHTVSQAKSTQSPIPRRRGSGGGKSGQGKNKLDETSRSWDDRSRKSQRSTDESQAKSIQSSLPRRRGGGRSRQRKSKLDDALSRQSRRSWDDRSRKSHRSNDENSYYSFYSRRLARSRSKSRTRTSTPAPLASTKRPMRNIFKGLLAKVQKNYGTDV